MKCVLTKYCKSVTGSVDDSQRNKESSGFDVFSGEGKCQGGDLRVGYAEGCMLVMEEH